MEPYEHKSAETVAAKSAAALKEYRILVFVAEVAVCRVDVVSGRIYRLSGSLVQMR